jgi:hypothetical protein
MSQIRKNQNQKVKILAIFTGFFITIFLLLILFFILNMIFIK